uniref:Major sperm protein n=1 Tax=Strongyloides papillosus TaxID=174720 RepID=A0A0N5CHX4_STREA
MENSLSIKTAKSTSSRASVTAISGSGSLTSLQLASTPQSPSTASENVKLLQTLKFNIIDGAEDLAQVRLLLCNLTPANLKFCLKSNQNDAVTCRSNPFGVIKAKDNYEILLSWYRLPEYKTWIDVPPLKMIIQSSLDSNNQEDVEESKNAIRFLGAVSTADPCKPENVPIEQLLLDSTLWYNNEKSKKGKLSRDSKSPSKSKKDEEELVNNFLYLLIILVVLFLLILGVQKK